MYKRRLDPAVAELQLEVPRRAVVGEARGADAVGVGFGLAFGDSAGDDRVSAPARCVDVVFMGRVHGAGAEPLALQADPELPEYALRNKVALLSPTNFLATMRTVASVWSVHKQNTNAQEIARRAGLLYDKFAGFVENLQGVGERLKQAQQSYEKAFGQLSTGAGNLLRQTETLRELGARNTRQLDAALVEQSDDETPALTVVKGEETADKHKS